MKLKSFFTLLIAVFFCANLFSQGAVTPIVSPRIALDYFYFSDSVTFGTLAYPYTGTPVVNLQIIPGAIPLDNTDSYILTFDETTKRLQYREASSLSGGSVTYQMSITSDGSGLKLVNDQLAPGNNYVYGTSSVGTKGWRKLKKLDFDDLTQGYVVVGGTGGSVDETIGSAYQVLRTNSAGTSYEWDTQLEEDAYNLRLGTNTVFGSLYNTVIGVGSKTGTGNGNTIVGYGINSANSNYSDNTIIGARSLVVNAGNMTVIGNGLVNAKVSGMTVLGTEITTTATGTFTYPNSNAPIYIGYHLIDDNPNYSTLSNIWIGQNIDGTGHTSASDNKSIIIAQNPTISNGMQSSIIIGSGASVLNGEPNNLVLGAGATAKLDATYGSSGGQQVILGMNTVGGSWRATVIGSYAQGLGVSTSVFGFGAYANKPHGDVIGRGGYNDLQDVSLFYGSPAAGTDKIGTFYLGAVASAHYNPAMPGGESVDIHTEQDAGTSYALLTTASGRDANAVPSYTNIKGTTLRIQGGASTGNDYGGNVQLGVTMAGGASNNTENTWDNALTIYGADARGYFDNGLGVGNTAGTTMNGRLHVTGYPGGSSATNSIYIESGTGELQAKFTDDNNLLFRSGTNYRWNFSGATLNMVNDAGIIRTARFQAASIEWSYLNNKTVNLGLPASSEASSYWYRVTSTSTSSVGTVPLHLLWLEPTYNFTGAATGDVHGIYYNPTVTSILGNHYFAYATSGRTKLGDVLHDDALTKVAVFASDNEIKYRDVSTIPNIAALSAETSLDMDDDNIIIYDASEGANNKVTLEELFDDYLNTYRKHAYSYYNEFINGVGTATGGNDVVSTSSGTGAASTGTAAITATNIVGLVTTTTGTTATGRSAISSYGSAITFGGGASSFEYRLDGISALSTVTERYAILVGFFDTYSAANQVDGVYFLYDEGGVSTGSAASANWQIVTASNSTRTFTTTSTAVATTGQTLRIEINAAGTSVEFFIDNVSVGTITTNIPTGTARATGFASMIIKSIGTTARVFNSDYMRVQVNYTTPKN